MNNEPDEHQQPHRATTWQTMSNESTRPGQTRLSDSQHLAIDVLLTGGTHREAAEAAGVARTTESGAVVHPLRDRRASHPSSLSGLTVCATGQQHVDREMLRVA